MIHDTDNLNTLSRAQGCLLGQLAGDSLGSLVEFQSPSRILAQFPRGLRDLADGGVWNTLAGQPTDDSEMALSLARMLVRYREYAPARARVKYLEWMHSRPFDIGNTTASGLSGHPMIASQANGALMRISPLGIFGARHELTLVADWARQDAAITHPHPICGEINALYAMAIAEVIRSGCTPAELYRKISDWASSPLLYSEEVRADVLSAASQEHPDGDLSGSKQGWVRIAFRNALWQLLHAPDLESGIINTVMRGGDTDTTAAICGALLGAVYGRDAVPLRWCEAILSCRPEAGRPGVCQPRPECYWPMDCLELAAQLLRQGA